MIRIIALGFVCVVLAILGFAATRPDVFRVERSTTVNAKPEKIFAEINDFQRWVAWSPFEKDPRTKREFGGAPAGKGSTYAWDGDRNLGQGRMEITQSTAPSKIVIALDFIRPMEAHNVGEFTLVPEGDSTRVTWTMDGPNTFLGKVMSVFLSMDKMVGGEFEKGLASLKAIAEK